MARSPAFGLALLVLACRSRSEAPPTRSSTLEQQPPEAPAAVAPSSSSAVPDTGNVLLALYRALRALGTDGPTIQGRLGKPRRATRETQLENDASTVDTLVRWQYDKVDFTFFRVSHDVLVETRAAADYAPVAALTSRFATLGLAMAATPGALQSTMIRGDTTVLVYGVTEPDGGSGNTITLHFVKGHLVQIGAQPFLD